MLTLRLYLKDYFPELGENGCNAYIDSYIPSAFKNVESALATKKYPCVLVCPGGAYSSTTDREAECVAMHFVAEGYRTIVVHYSCAPYCFPQHLREMAGVMELVHKNADEWNIDISKTAVIGFSAGAHLAAQYSNRYDCNEVRQVFSKSKPVQAAILSYPVITDDPQYINPGSFHNYLGYTPTNRNEKGCSNECMVSEKTPPTFIWHTAEDKGVLVQNSLLYAKALADHKVSFEMHIYPFGKHGLSTVDGVTHAVEPETNVARAHQWICDVKTWLKMMWVE